MLVTCFPRQSHMCITFSLFCNFYHTFIKKQNTEICTLKARLDKLEKPKKGSVQSHCVSHLARSQVNTAFNRRAGETPALLSFANRFVEIEYMILVEIGPERRVLFNLQPPEQLARVARLVVVGTQHPGRHRLAEAAAAGDTAVMVLGVERGVDQRYQRDLSTYSCVTMSRNSKLPLFIYVPMASKQLQE